MSTTAPVEQGSKERTTKWMHLWNAANIMIATAPTISRHLGHKLVTEAEQDMSSYTKGLICEHCGTLAYPSSSTRIRKRRHALRNRRNEVVITCTQCQSVRKEGASCVIQKQPKIKAKKKFVTGNRAKQQSIICKGEEEKNANGHRVLKKFTKSTNPSHKSKKKRTMNIERQKKTQNKNKKRSTGLASSFLFDEIEE